MPALYLDMPMDWTQWDVVHLRLGSTTTTHRTLLRANEKDALDGIAPSAYDKGDKV